VSGEQLPAVNTWVKLMEITTNMYNGYRVKAAIDLDPRLFRQLFSPWFVNLCPQNGIGKGMKKVTDDKVMSTYFHVF
jgi:hypothetical protein